MSACHISGCIQCLVLLLLAVTTTPCLTTSQFPHYTISNTPPIHPHTYPHIPVRLLHQHFTFTPTLCFHPNTLHSPQHFTFTPTPHIQPNTSRSTQHLTITLLPYNYPNNHPTTLTITPPPSQLPTTPQSPHHCHNHPQASQSPHPLTITPTLTIHNHQRPHKHPAPVACFQQCATHTYFNSTMARL